MQFFLFLLGSEIMATAIFTGFLLSLISIVQPVFNSLSAEESTFFMQRFLSFAYKNAFFSFLTFLCASLPVVLTLLFFVLRQEVGKIAILILIILGWLFFVGGVMVLTQRVNAPLYKDVSQWSPKELAPDWQEVQRKWYGLNRIRAGAAAAALLLYFVAFLLAS